MVRRHCLERTSAGAPRTCLSGVLYTGFPDFRKFVAAMPDSTLDEAKPAAAAPAQRSGQSMTGRDGTAERRSGSSMIGVFVHNLLELFRIRNRYIKLGKKTEVD